MRSNFPFLPYSSNQYPTIYCSTPFFRCDPQASHRPDKQQRQESSVRFTFLSICLQMTSKHHTNFIIKFLIISNRVWVIPGLFHFGKSGHEPQEKLQTPSECRASSALDCAQSVAHIAHQTSTHRDNHTTLSNRYNKMPPSTRVSDPYGYSLRQT